MKTAILTAIWQRERVTRRCMAYMQQMQARADAMGIGEIDLYCVGSEGETSQKIANKYGYEYVEYDNHPLWKKWEQAALLAGGGYDCYLIMGADNICTPAYLAAAHIYVRAGYQYMQPSQCAFYEPVSKRMSLLQGFDGGAGRVFGQKLYKKLKGKLWHPNTLSSMDHYQKVLVHMSTEYQERAHLPLTLETPWQLIDIKHGGMWPWSDYDPHRNPLCKEVNARPYIEHFFPDFEWHHLAEVPEDVS